MKILDYENKNKIYICHFPGDSELLQKEVYNHLKKQKFKINNNISIISIVNNDCLNSCLLYKQYNFIYNKNALNKEWHMPDKIKYILELLKDINTEYCIITDARDVLITANLDNNFINNFLDYNCDILYNATISKYPKLTLQSDYHIKGKSGKFKYLNAGLCIGKTKSLLDWYQYLNNNFIYESESEQYILRKLYNNSFNIKIDGKRKLFRTCHGNDTIWFKSFNKLYLDYSNPINLNNKLQYKYLLPNKKIIKGKLKNIYRIGEKSDINYILMTNNYNFTFSKKSVLVLYLYNYIDFSFFEKYNCFSKIKFIFRGVCKDFEKLINWLLTDVKFNCLTSVYIENLPDNINLPLDERIKIIEEKNNKQSVMVLDKKINRYFKLKCSYIEALRLRERFKVKEFNYVN